MPNSSTSYTPFFMVHGAEAMLPAEVRRKAPRVVAYSEAKSTDALEDVVDTHDEARDIAATHSAVYQQSLHNYHSRRLRPRSSKETSSYESSKSSRRSWSHPRKDHTSSPKSSQV